MNEEDMNLKEINYVLKHNILLIIIITIICTIISGILSFNVIKPKYEASTKLLIQKYNNGKYEYNYNDIEMYQSLLKTYVEIIQSDKFINEAIKDEDIDLSSTDIIKNLEIKPQAETQILVINYTGTNKEICRKILYLINDQLNKQIQKLMPQTKIELVDNINVSEKPISPNKKVWVVCGFLIGLLLSILVSILKEYIRNRFISILQIEGVLDIPVIGVIMHK